MIFTEVAGGGEGVTSKCGRENNREERGDN